MMIGSPATMMISAYWKRGTGPWPCQPNWPKYESDKIIITAQGNRNAKSQLLAAMEYEGIYPGKHFLAVVLHDDWSELIQRMYASRPKENTDILRWLCAILNSPLGHAWFAEHAGPRGPRAEVVTGMPLPQSYDPAISETVAAIAKLSRPRNLREIATWNPEAGIIPEDSDLFGEGARSKPVATTITGMPFSD